MKRSAFFAILLALLMLTACTNFADDSEVDYEDEETEIAASESVDSEFEETESVVEATGEALDSNYGESAREYLEAIANGIGDREPGSAGEAQTAEYIQGVFEEIGYQPEMVTFSVEGDEEEEIDPYSSANVIAVKEGRSDQVIVVGAHYDAAYEDGTSGADDNASGVAVMLEAAKLVFDTETPYTLHFVAFGSEEWDLNGSTYYVNSLGDEDVIGMFNLDSLIAGDKMYVYGNTGSGSMRDWVLEDADRLGFEVEGKTNQDLNNADGTPCECADYDAFEKAEIPFAYFEATNWDLSPDAMVQVDPQYGSEGEIRHTQYDNVAYLDENFPGRIDERLNVFVTLLYDLLTQYQ